MLGRIPHLALGRRSRWVVIGVWVALAIGLGWLQPKLQTKAADESETFRARGAESTRVHDLLERAFREGRWSTSIIAFVAKDGSALRPLGRVSDDLDKICGTVALPDLVGVAGAGGVACGDVGHQLGPSRRPRRSPATIRRRWSLLPVFNGRDDTDSLVRDVTALRTIVPEPTDSPLAAFVTGQAGFDADRALAVEGIDGTLLAITGASCWC